jgi:AraC-like DNA-binding protein
MRPPGRRRAVAPAVVRPHLDDLTAGDLAEVTGRSRFAVHRAFSYVYRMPPSDYQRQLRLREARALIAAGTPSSWPPPWPDSPTSHLFRWSVRYYGVTPGRYQRATAPAGPGFP